MREVLGEWGEGMKQKNIASGPLSDRPAAATVPEGFIYCADDGAVYQRVACYPAEYVEIRPARPTAPSIGELTVLQEAAQASSLGRESTRELLEAMREVWSQHKRTEDRLLRLMARVEELAGVTMSSILRG